MNCLSVHSLSGVSQWWKQAPSYGPGLPCIYALVHPHSPLHSRQHKSDKNVMKKLFSPFSAKPVVPHVIVQKRCAQFYSSAGTIWYFLLFYIHYLSSGTSCERAPKMSSLDRRLREVVTYESLDLSPPQRLKGFFSGGEDPLSANASHSGFI